MNTLNYLRQNTINKSLLPTKYKNNAAFALNLSLYFCAKFSDNLKGNALKSATILIPTDKRNSK